MLSVCVEFDFYIKSLGIRGVTVSCQSLRLQSTEGSETQSTTEKDEKADQQHYEENIRHQILEASLPFVPELGWSRNAISAGQKKV